MVEEPLGRGRERTGAARIGLQPRLCSSGRLRRAAPELRSHDETTLSHDETGMKSGQRAPEEPASRLIDQRIRDLGGWRGETLARMRALILKADPGMIEEWKWGVPVWSHHGIVCTGESYTKVVKLTFARGASVPDPARLFNSSLEGKTRRAIDIHEGEKVDAVAFKALVKAAVARNGTTAKKRQIPGRKR
jgi:hypothetical protein